MRRLFVLLGCLLADTLSSRPAMLLAEQGAQGTLLVGVGVHVEPFGLLNGQVVTGARGGSYDDEDDFRRHVEFVRSLTRTIEAHGGRATVQVQSPFIDSCTKYGDNVIGEWASRGHEIAFHFHEDAHLGSNAEALAVERWIDVMGGQLAKIRALGVDRVRTWSGGNLYPHLLEAAAAVGLDVMSDWKDPNTRTADFRLHVTTPWRPAGSPSGTDLSAFLRNDAAGKIVYLPAGAIDAKAIHEDEISASADPARALQEYWTDGLSGSLSSVAANPSATHVFHLTLHPGELQGDRYGGDATLDAWLGHHIDPLVTAGKVRWATYSQMKDAYAVAASRARVTAAGVSATVPPSGGSVPSPIQRRVDPASDPGPSSGAPRSGFYAIGLRGTAPTTELLEKPFVDGVSLALEWRQIEPTEGGYDFSIIDATLAALEPYGKRLVLAPFSFRVPDYLITDPRVQTYLVPHIGPGFITPVPWDIRGLERYEALYAALSDHEVPDRSRGGRLLPLRDHPLLVGVSSWVMGMNGIRDIAQLSGQASPLYAQPGYSRDALTSGILRSMHTVVDRFPGQFHYVPFFRIADQTPSPRLDDHLLATIKREFFDGSGPPQVGLFQENLACSAPSITSASALYQEQANTYVMFQMLQRWIAPIPGYEGSTDRCMTMTRPGDRTTATSGPELAIQFAYDTYGARYFEVYLEDLLHPGFADEFQLWHDRVRSP